MPLRVSTVTHKFSAKYSVLENQVCVIKVFVSDFVLTTFHCICIIMPLKTQCSPWNWLCLTSESRNSQKHEKMGLNIRIFPYNSKISIDLCTKWLLLSLPWTLFTCLGYDKQSVSAKDIIELGITCIRICLKFE